jgi:hypothetical protein
VICPSAKAKYFFSQDWTLESALILQANFSSTRNRDYAEFAAAIKHKGRSLVPAQAGRRQ